MSAWPWMQGIEVAIADPIPPVCPEDDRPAKLKTALDDHPLFDYANRHDYLWLLRFWLSHKKSKQAIAAAKQTLEFRKKHKLDTQDLRDFPPTTTETGHVYDFLKSCKSDVFVFSHPDPQRGVVMFYKYASMDQHKLAKNISEEGYLDFAIHCSE